MFPSSVSYSSKLSNLKGVEGYVCVGGSLNFVTTSDRSMGALGT